MVDTRPDTATTPGLPGPLQQLARNAWQAVLLIGVSAVLLGIMALAWPHATLVVIGVLFGIYLLVSGVMQLIVTGVVEIATAIRIRSDAVKFR